MFRAVRIALGITAIALLGLTVWGACGLTKHIIVAVDKLGDAGAGLAQTTARLNGPHGTITMADEDVGAAKSLIVHADLVARHEQQQLSVLDQRGTDLYHNLNGALTDLRGTIHAATGSVTAATETANAATRALGEGQRSIAAAQPVLGEVEAAVKAFRDMTPDIDRAVKGSADTAEQTAATMGDVHKVADHFEKEIDDPHKRPWYIRILPATAQDAVQALFTKWSVK